MGVERKEQFTNDYRYFFLARLGNDGDRQFRVSGKVRLKMSDFGIDPPTALFGTIKTDVEVEVKYRLEFTKVN